MLARRWEFWVVVIMVCFGILSVFEPEESFIDFSNIKEEISEKVSSVFSEAKTSSGPSNATKKEEEPGLVDRFLNFWSFTETSKPSKYGDFLTEQGAVSRAIKDFKSSHGNSLVVYHSFVIYPDHLSFDRQDPKKPEKIDRFFWNENVDWRAPEPQKAPKKEELNEYLVDLTEVDFDFLPGLIQWSLAEAEKAGILDGKVKYVVFMRKNSQDPKREPMIQLMVEGARKEITVRADKKGNIYEVIKR